MKHFFWPKFKQDVAKYCRTCHACQIVWKPNQKINVATVCGDELAHENLKAAQSKLKENLMSKPKNVNFLWEIRLLGILRRLAIMVIMR